MKKILGWMLAILMLLGLMGCQNSTGPGQTDRPVPVQYQEISVPIITSIP